MKFENIATLYGFNKGKDVVLCLSMKGVEVGDRLKLYKEVIDLTQNDFSLHEILPKLLWVYSIKNHPEISIEEFVLLVNDAFNKLELDLKELATVLGYDFLHNSHLSQSFINPQSQAKKVLYHKRVTEN